MNLSPKDPMPSVLTFRLKVQVVWILLKYALQMEPEAVSILV